MIGQRFDRWAVLRRADMSDTGMACWHCVCDCGIEKIVQQHNLVSGQSRSCGCLKREMSWARSRDITGQRFGRLTAIRMTVRGTKKPQRRNERWLLRCDCGNETETTKTAVVNGYTQSCGCLQAEVSQQSGKKNATHGHTRAKRRSSEYIAWCNMHTRCRNENAENYRLYGARGITVCERWSSFENFLADLGPKPSPRHEIDRYPDNDGHYEPGNCRWTTKVEQHNNKRTNHLLTVDGQTLTVAEWAREANILPVTLHRRIRDGWHSDWVLVPFPGMNFYEG